MCSGGSFPPITARTREVQLEAASTRAERVVHKGRSRNPSGLESNPRTRALNRGNPNRGRTNEEATAPLALFGCSPL